MCQLYAVVDVYAPRRVDAHPITIPSTSIRLFFFLTSFLLITTNSYLIKITDTTKLGLTLPLTVLQKIPKLQDHEGYLKWKRAMRDHIKMFALSVSEPPGKMMTEKKEWTKATRSNLHSNQNLCMIEGNTYNDIENITNANILLGNNP